MVSPPSLPVTPAIDIRPYNAGSDFPALAAFYRDCWADPRRAEQLRSLLAWQYEDNPYASRYAHYIAVQDGLVLAQVATVQVEVLVSGRRIPGCWLVDFMVRPEYRQRALGPLLLRQVGRDFPLCMTLGMTEAAVPLYLRLGWTDVGESRFWWRVLRWRPLLSTYPRFRRVSTFLGPLLDLMEEARRPVRPRPPGSEDVRAVPGFDASFEALLRAGAVDYPVLVARTVPYLNWRYAGKPGTRYRVLAAYRRGQPCGYVVLAQSRFRASLRMGVIVDLLTRRDDASTRRTLLQAALHMFHREQMDIVSANTTSPALEHSLRQMGFRQRGIGQRVMADLSRATDVADVMAHRANWFLTRGDADGDNDCW